MSTPAGEPDGVAAPNDPGWPANQVRIFGKLGVEMLFYVASIRIGMALSFPIGGFESHAIFAYTDEGRFDVAAQAFGVMLLSCVAVAVHLTVRTPTRWRTTALLGTAAGLWYWQGIAYGPTQGADFHRSVLMLFPLIPIVIGATCLLTARLTGRSGPT